MEETKVYERQDLLRLEAKDGSPIDALLVTSKHEKMRDVIKAPMLLQLHGLLGHFLARGTPRLLPHALLKYGYSSMSINTRLAFAGQITGKGIFDDTIYDIDAAIKFLQYEGFRNIFILGYSLGASMLVNWAAKREHAKVRGLILEGVHHAIPDSQKKDFTKWGSTPSYEEIYEKAKKILGNDPYNSPNDETFVVCQSRGPNHTPSSSEIFTYKTWWFMTGPEAVSARAHQHIDKIKIPVLMLRGEGDFLIEGWEPEALSKILREAGNKHVRVREIKGAKHDCMENPDQMLEEIHTMLSKFSK
ncbi:alpha/beta hydrolase [Candidatus Omnitrophota bacterium]